MEKEKIIEVIRHIVTLLVEKQYDNLFSEDIDKTISSLEMQDAIAEYGGGLTMPPIDEFDKLDIYEVDNNKSKVDFDLWINSKKSDLTLSCTIYNKEGAYRYSIDNIHVL